MTTTRRWCRLLAAARRRGWAALPRKIADSFLLDMPAKQTEGPWPRNSTLKKNRFHEKHLARHGALAWEFVERWDDATFADLAHVEETSWIADRTDGSDAKFTGGGHGAFWRAAAADPIAGGDDACRGVAGGRQAPRPSRSMSTQAR